MSIVNNDDDDGDDDHQPLFTGKIFWAFLCTSLMLVLLPEALSYFASFVNLHNVNSIHPEYGIQF